MAWARKALADMLLVRGIVFSISCHHLLKQTSILPVNDGSPDSIRQTLHEAKGEDSVPLTGAGSV